MRGTRTGQNTGGPALVILTVHRAPETEILMVRELSRRDVLNAMAAAATAKRDAKAALPKTAAELATVVANLGGRTLAS